MNVSETFVLRRANAKNANEEYVAYSDYFNIPGTEDLGWTASSKSFAYQFSTIEEASKRQSLLLNSEEWAKNLEVVRWIWLKKW